MRASWCVGFADAVNMVTVVRCDAFNKAAVLCCSSGEVVQHSILLPYCSAVVQYMAAVVHYGAAVVHCGAVVVEYGAVPVQHSAVVVCSGVLYWRTGHLVLLEAAVVSTQAQLTQESSQIPPSPPIHLSAHHQPSLSQLNQQRTQPTQAHYMTHTHSQALDAATTRLTHAH